MIYVKTQCMIYVQRRCICPNTMYDLCPNTTYDLCQNTMYQMDKIQSTIQFQFYSGLHFVMYQTDKILSTIQLWFLVDCILPDKINSLFSFGFQWIAFCHESKRTSPTVLGVRFESGHSHSAILHWRYYISIIVELVVGS